MAAIVAARNGANVTIFERQDRVGRKILSTGNGRCNLTNVNISSANYQCTDPHFVDPALSLFSTMQARDFFNEIGALTLEEDEGKVFPVTGQASTILDVLRSEAQRLGIATSTQSEIMRISKNSDGFTFSSNGNTYSTDKIILACGGSTMPHLGGSDKGLRLCQSFGHKVIDQYPVLVPLKTSNANLHHKGVKVQGVASVTINGGSLVTMSGEFLFTDYGLSGPPIIQLSLVVQRALRHGKKVKLALDMLPHLTFSDLLDNLQNRCSRRPDDCAETMMIGIVHKRLIRALLMNAGIDDPLYISSSLKPEQMRRVVASIKGWNFDITGALSWNEAHVMAGGIDTSDIVPDTMESRKIPGLYIIGEMLDVTGDCGGYNLQWAWSSGFCAAIHASGI